MLTRLSLFCETFARYWYNIVLRIMQFNATFLQMSYNSCSCHKHGDCLENFVRHLEDNLTHELTGKLTNIIETFAHTSYNSFENTGNCLATSQFANELMIMFINSLATGQWEKNKRE